MHENTLHGVLLQTVQEESKFTCYYKNDRPFLKLAPIKCEVVHLKPKIIVLRNLLSDYEIDVIKKMAAPKV